MRVLCVTIINPATDEEVLMHDAITRDAEYHVLEIISVSGERTKIRVLADDGQPSLWAAEMFASLDTNIPESWVCRLSEGGVMTLGPNAFIEPGFWEQYFDRRPDAVSIFDAEIARMYPTLGVN